jgi:head-tail adaptor
MPANQYAYRVTLQMPLRTTRDDGQVVVEYTDRSRVWARRVATRSTTIEGAQTVIQWPISWAIRNTSGARDVSAEWRVVYGPANNRCVAHVADTEILGYGRTAEMVLHCYRVPEDP